MTSGPLRLAAGIFGLLLIAAAGGASAVSAGTSRSAGLEKAWSAPESVRSVFFVRNMSCRACTFLLDRSLAAKKGVFWTRFNYPLRLLVIYHDPGLMPVSAVEDFIAGSGELSVKLMESRPAGNFRPTRETPPARWKGGILTLEEARKAPEPFKETLRGMMIEEGTEEWSQVAYEIAGEAARNRIFLGLARGGGYGAGKAEAELPVVIAKDFYWPLELMALTADEAAVAQFVREEIIENDETEVGRQRFDEWLLTLWKDLSFDFRGEILEVQ